MEKIISTYYANIKKNILICNICKKYNTDNLRSLARHKQCCKNKQTDDAATSSESKSPITEW